MTVITPRLFPVEQHDLTSDDYYTPRWVFDRMAITFDLDVCAPPGGIEWIPAARHFTQADDGLAQPWHGRVWMNPPFSKPTPWVARFIDHRHGIALLPHSKSAWHINLWREADALAGPSDGSFDFIGFGDRSGSIFMPVFFAAFGDECVEAISRLGVVRVRP